MRHQKTSITFLSLIFYVLIINSASGIDQLWSIYPEKEGKFELKYPSSWITGDTFNESNEDGLKFYTDIQNKYQTNEIMQVGIGHRDAELVAPGMNLNTTLRLDSVLFIKKFKDELQNFSVLGEPNFNKYNINGHPSLYFEFSYVKSLVPKKGFFIASDINNSIFYILFEPDQSDFIKTLPIANEIISSVKLHIQ
jgi:hypothetical protein